MTETVTIAMTMTVTGAVTSVVTDAVTSAVTHEAYGLLIGTVNCAVICKLTESILSAGTIPVTG